MDSVVLSAAFVREVIVVQSNSPPQFKEFCAHELAVYEKYFNVVVLDSGTPSNGSVARNVGINSASAEYVALLDDDDEWMEGKIKQYLDFIASENLTGDFVVFSPVISCNELRGEVVVVPSIKYRRQPIADYILAPLGGAQTSALLLPAILARRVGFDPTLDRHQDYDFCIRLEEAGATFHQLEKPLAYWYRRGTMVNKGATFEYCAQWVQKNARRFSRAAYISYVEKDLLRSARQSNRMMEYWGFVWMHFTVLERTSSIMRLCTRAIVSLVGRVRFRNSTFDPTSTLNR
jgi:glycosyltransferase involved in cell wall biosynthesis